MRTGHALSLAMLDNPKFGYMTLSNERSKSGTEEDNDEADAVVPECDRANCKNASAPLSTQTGLKKPICVQ